MTTPESFTFAAEPGGAAVFARRWLPAGRARAVVPIVHGMAEHSGRYDRFARFLAGRGCAVYALDLPAHGATATPASLGHAGATAWEAMRAAVDRLAALARDEQPGVPVVAFGHSMGSALTQAWIQTAGAGLAGAVLCGTFGALPELGVPVDALLQQLGALAGAEPAAPSPVFAQLVAQLNAPFATGPGPVTGCEWQTRDPDELRAFVTDPLCAKPFSNATAYSVVKGFGALWVPEAEARVPADLPLFVIAGTQDTVSDRTRTIRHLIARYLARGHRALAWRFYEGLRHEVLNEPERERVQADVWEWIAGVIT